MTASVTRSILMAAMNSGRPFRRNFKMTSDTGCIQTELSPPLLAVRKLGANCHVAFDGAYYSAPHTLYNEMVVVRATDSTVDILDNSGMCVASHFRSYVKRQYVTDPTHMPGVYYSIFYDQPSRYDGAKLRSWAKNIGDKTFQVIDLLLERRPIEEQAYKGCMAILQLAKKNGASFLESACSRALSNRSVSFAAIQRFIKLECDKRLNHE